MAGKRWCRGGRLVGAVVGVLALITGVGGARAGDPGPASTDKLSLQATELPAAGTQATVLSVPRFGVYSVAVTSGAGTALSLVDRMAGTLATDGTAGERDGRLDLLLDRGEVRVVTQGPPEAAGEVKLAVRAFTEKSPTPAPRLLDGKLVATDLGDFEQRSFWLDLPKAQRVVLEAAGRHLNDLRLWQDGSWLVEAEPVTSVLESVKGRPLTLCQLTAQLEPGLYLLTAYGGRERPWSVDAPDRPLYLRSGLPRLPEAGRRRFVTSPFGFDTFLVSGLATHYRLELPKTGQAQLTAARFDPEQPFAEDTDTASITEKSVPPVATLERDELSPGLHRITVWAKPGQPYLLQQMRSQNEYPIDPGGTYWIAAFSSGHPEDSIDLTGVLLDSKSRVLASQVVPLGPGQPWQRRFNLLAPATLHVQVKVNGRYELLAKGTRTRFRFEPFPLPTRGYKAPVFEEAGKSVELSAGLYLLSLEPVEPGIVSLLLRPSDLLGRALEWAGLGADTPISPVRAGLLFPALAVPIEGNLHYRLVVNRQPGLTIGVVLREHPLDPLEPLPVVQGPGEELEIPFETQTDGQLRAQGEDGQPLAFSLDGAPAGTAATVLPGAHTVRTSNPGERPAFYSLALEPTALAADRPLPAIAPERLAKLPKLTPLTEQEPVFFDLKEGASRTFLLRADHPALWRLESTGLLATAGRLRTRTVTNLVEESENGVGRNFLVQRYLREGDYQVTVTALGRSAGHLGVRLGAAPVADGGSLSPGVPARRSLAVGEGVAYSFEVPAEGRYRVQAIGQERDFPVRLEDADGWPLVPEMASGEEPLPAGAGRYRLIVLPGATEGRVLALYERADAPPPREGHGPHPLPLERAVEHVWRETGEGEARAADRWRLRLDGPTPVTVRLSEGMTGELRRLGQGEVVGRVLPGRSFSGPLGAGEYELATRAVWVNDRLPYTVSVWPEALVAGVERRFDAPDEARLSVGEAGLYEISSFGPADVQARLLDSQAETVAMSWDRPDDWNFLLVQRLRAGEYQLQVDRTGDLAETTVSVRRLGETAAPPLAVPGRRSFTPGREVLQVPLTIPPAVGLAVVAASSAETVGLAFERLEGGAWRTVATRVGRQPWVAVPLGPGEEARLRVWSVDGRGLPIELAAGLTSAPTEGEAALERGLALVPVRGLEGRFVAAAVAPGPGCFGLEPWPGLLVGHRQGAALEPAGVAFSSINGLLWAASPAADTAGERLRGHRLQLGESSTALDLGLPARGEILCDVAPGPVLVTARAVGGQPAAAFWAGRHGRPTSGLDRSVALAPEAALVASLDREPDFLTVWAPRASDLAVGLTAHRFSWPAGSEVAPWGVTSTAAPAAGARVFDLPEGAKTARLVLAPGVAAVLATGETVRSVHWADREGIDETFETEASSLWLFDLAGGGGSARLELLPVDPRGRLALSGEVFESRRAHAGTVRLALPDQLAEAGGRLRVRGATAARVVTAAGEVFRGLDLPLPATGGTLIVDHPPGHLLVATVDPEDGRSRLGLTRRQPAVEPLELPARVQLSGPARRYAIDQDGPVLVSLETATGVIAEVVTAQGVSRLEVLPDGGRLDAYLPAGEGEIRLAGLAGQDLAGTAEVVAQTPVAIAEGLGPEAVLGAGDSRAYRFEVPRKGPVGVGARASSDVVESRLLADDGRELGRGAVQLHDLTPGLYLLTVSVPRDAGPLTVRPAVVGIDPPPTLPPGPVIQCYVVEAGDDPAKDCLALAEEGEERARNAPVRGRPLVEADEEEECVECDEMLDESDEEESGDA